MKVAAKEKGLEVEIAEDREVDLEVVIGILVQGLEFIYEMLISSIKSI